MTRTEATGDTGARSQHRTQPGAVAASVERERGERPGTSEPECWAGTEPEPGTDSGPRTSGGRVSSGGRWWPLQSSAHPVLLGHPLHPPAAASPVSPVSYRTQVRNHRTQQPAASGDGASPAAGVSTKTKTTLRWVNSDQKCVEAAVCVLY